MVNLQLTNKEAEMLSDLIAMKEDYASYDDEICVKYIAYKINGQLKDDGGDGCDFSKDLQDGDNFAAITFEDSVRLALVTELIRTGKFAYSTPTLMASDLVEKADAIIYALNRKK